MRSSNLGQNYTHLQPPPSLSSRYRFSPEMSRHHAVQIDDIEELPINPDGLQNHEFLSIQNNLHHIITMIESGRNSQFLDNAIYGLLKHIVFFRLQYRWDTQTYNVSNELIAKIISKVPDFVQRYESPFKANRCVLLSGIQYIRDDFPELSEQLIYSDDVIRLTRDTIKYDAPCLLETHLINIVTHFKNNRYPPRHHKWWSREMYDSDYANYYLSQRNLCCFQVSKRCFLTIEYSCLSISCIFILALVTLLGMFVLSHIHVQWK